jgi:GPH family glycoside/pentoside/hexuronide:cation symporter
MKGTTGEVPWAVRLAYAFPAFSLAAIGIPIYIYLPKFYTDTVGMDIATVGILLMAVRLFDAVTDPVIGYVSDHMHTPWGRRRSLIGPGAVGLAVALYALFTPPSTPGNDQAFRFAFWLFSLFLCWTLVTVPYESLGPELSTDYHERTTLFALRDGCLIFGTLVAAASPTLASLMLNLAGLPDDERARFTAIALIYGPLVLVAAGLCLWRVREKPLAEKINGDPFWSGFAGVFRNRPFVILLAAFTISSLGNNLPATLILYYVEYVLHSSRAELFLALYFVVGIAFIPFWVRLSRKTGKKTAWIASMVINTGAFMGVFVLGPGDERAYGVLVALSGVGFGAGLVLPSSIQADVIDYDELMTGNRREGRYIGLWSISKKLAAAVGVGAGLWLLGRTGYTPDAAQNDMTVQMLRYLYALVPCFCQVIAIVIICFYPITESRFLDIQHTLRSR